MLKKKETFFNKPVIKSLGKTIEPKVICGNFLDRNYYPVGNYRFLSTF